MMEELVDAKSIMVDKLKKKLYSYNDFLSCIYSPKFVRGEWSEGKGYVFYLHNDLSHYTNAMMRVKRDGKVVEVDFLTEIVDRLYTHLYYLSVLMDVNKLHIMSCEINGRIVMFGVVMSYYHQGRCEAKVYVNGISMKQSRNPMFKYLRHIAKSIPRLYLLHSCYDGYSRLYSKQILLKVSAGGLNRWNVGILPYAITCEKLMQTRNALLDRGNKTSNLDASGVLAITPEADLVLNNEIASKPNHFEYPFL